MTETIKGGAYKLPDGSWVNGKGEKIPAPSGEVYPQVPETEVVSEDQVTPGASLVDEFGKPEEMVQEKKPRKPRAKKAQ